MGLDHFGLKIQFSVVVVLSQFRGFNNIFHKRLLMVE